MRHKEKVLVKLKHYNEAEDVKYKCDTLEENERK